MNKNYAIVIIFLFFASFKEVERTPFLIFALKDTEMKIYKSDICSFDTVNNWISLRTRVADLLRGRQFEITKVTACFNNEEYNVSICSGLSSGCNSKLWLVSSNSDIFFYNRNTLVFGGGKWKEILKEQ